MQSVSRDIDYTSFLFLSLDTKILRTDSNEDISGTVLELVAGSKSITFTVEHSTPNPFEGVTANWTFSGAEDKRLPFGVRQQKLNLIFDTIHDTNQQPGNYSITFGDLTVSFELVIMNEGEYTPSTCTRHP
jgi:hypothetical protein